MCRQITDEQKRQNIKTKDWYDEFMTKVASQNKNLVEELDRMRARIVSVETTNMNSQ